MSTHAAQFPSTVAISVERHVLPGRHRPVAVVSLDSTPSGGLILWSSAALRQLGDTLRDIDQAAVEAIVVIGNERSFGAGANLDEIAHGQESGDPRAYIAAGHEVFGLLAEARVPTFSVITGQALGGGLELALHTGYRIGNAKGGPLGLPECRLGFFPGWGGVHLLPHLVGPEAAIDAITFDSMRGRHLRPVQAAEIGLLDAVLEEGPQSEGWAAAWQAAVVEVLDALGGEQPRRPGESRQTPESLARWRAAVGAAREKADRLWHGAAPAPLAALDLIEAAATESRVENGAQAVSSFQDLVTGDIARTSLRTFRSVDSRARKAPDRPAVAGRRIEKVAVVGAGLMARQLAALFARSLRVPVVLTDIDRQRLDEGVQWVADRFASQAERGALEPSAARQLAALVTGATGDGDLADVDFLIEATPEDLEIKKAVLSHWAGVVGEGTVLATNTSSLSVTEMSRVIAHPGRFLGFHVFNPVDATPLLEIITTSATDDIALATAFDLASSMRRTAVRVADAPGFVVNRILLRMFDPILQALDAGVDPREADHALDSLGLPMTPLQLLDFVGPAVLSHVGQRMHAAYPDRFHVSPWMTAVADAGLTHVLPRRGDESETYLEGRAESLRLAVREAGGEDGEERSRSVSATEGIPELKRRVEDALAQEIGLMLDDGVIAQPEDVDVCMVLGANWPLYLGGITPYLDRAGASERVLGRRFGA